MKYLIAIVLLFLVGMAGLIALPFIGKWMYDSGIDEGGVFFTMMFAYIGWIGGILAAIAAMGGAYVDYKLRKD